MSSRARRPVIPNRRVRVRAAGPRPPRGPVAPLPITVNLTEKETPVTPAMTTEAPITLLRPNLQRVAQHLVEGLTPRQIAMETGRSPVTIRQYVRDIRVRLQCPPRCKMAVLAHFLLATRQVNPPSTDRPTPELSTEQLLLIRAVAEHSKVFDIASAAKIVPADVRYALDELCANTGTSDGTQLVVLAHAWGLLGSGPTGKVESGAVQ